MSKCAIYLVNSKGFVTLHDFDLDSLGKGHGVHFHVQNIGQRDGDLDLVSLHLGMEDGFLDGLDPVSPDQLRVGFECIFAVVGEDVEGLVVVGSWLSRECVLEIDGLDGIVYFLINPKKSECIMISPLGIANDLEMKETQFQGCRNHAVSTCNLIASLF